ncbi:hypothetical protein FHR81_003601 [Actinoalloteichus hoggarensis]|uniref:Uncharacterized protein n=1 Tax=Actinoalloteichus hoggarensis TaxID=1470176 RepID=A0A221WAA6_9PSEU|nr:hypothetical protein [Actinoalloteichus hoggarensis]ASO22940.1 hypothetical protein AHOG_26705 [Actinoalloteichus hoggarensis]MBB5922544.1 hypothetical protein [Actinoalloteichus hoggarensis]
MTAYSTADHVALVEDLRRLVASRLIDSVEILLPVEPALAALRERLRIDAEVWAAQLLGPDDRLASGVLARLIAALYPGDSGFDPPADWWRTPLGRVTARRLGHPTVENVPFAQAGAMLGITRQGVHDLVRRGKLTGHPAGGVSADSVRDRLAVLHASSNGSDDGSGRSGRGDSRV